MRDHLIAGGLSGMTVDFILFPLDTIKTRLQARKSATNAIPKTGAFYKGLLSAMLVSFPGAATFWTVYQNSKAQLELRAGPNASPWLLAASHVAAASIADTCVCLIRNPFEVVKQQMQLGLHKSTAEAFRTILRVDGARGLSAGFLSTIAREVPFDAVQFVMYEYMKASLMQHQGRDLELWQNMGLGFVCGGTAAALTTPLDVAKTQLMTQTNTAKSLRYTGVIHALTSIYKEGGMAALFAGVKPRVAWISIGGAIFIGSFEEYTRLLKRAEH